MRGMQRRKFLVSLTLIAVTFAGFVLPFLFTIGDWDEVLLMGMKTIAKPMVISTIQSRLIAAVVPTKMFESVFGSSKTAATTPSPRPNSTTTLIASVTPTHGLVFQPTNERKDREEEGSGFLPITGPSLEPGNTQASRPTSVPATKTSVPTAVPPTSVPPTSVPPTSVPPTAVPPSRTPRPPTRTPVPPTPVPPTPVPPTVVPPTVKPPTVEPTEPPTVEPTEPPPTEPPPTEPPPTEPPPTEPPPTEPPPTEPPGATQPPTTSAAFVV